jgi:putative DNA methylase
MRQQVKRLIEVDLPIKRISTHARREKSIRHGHISTMHIWWARRPLAACRAVLCAALWPDPVDPLCGQKFREDACHLINEFAVKAASDKALSQLCSSDTWRKWQLLAKPENRLDPRREAHWNVLRFALLDFIADFANWDNSSVVAYLDLARALTQSAHESLGGVPGTKPLVVDPFVGGGSIPLEALRVGADAFGSDLNPVAVLLNKVLLEYIPKYGERLTNEVLKWGEKVRAAAEQRLSEYYPKGSNGSVAVSYLWARTVVCEGPKCGTTIPLLRSRWLAEGTKKLAIELKPRRGTTNIDCEIVNVRGTEAIGPGTVHRGAATCPVCGYTTLASNVRRQFAARRGGAHDAQTDRRVLVRYRKSRSLTSVAFSIFICWV